MKEGFQSVQNILEQKKILEQVDNLNCYTPSKIDLLLAAEGLKPTTDITLGTWAHPLTNEQTKADEEEKFKQVSEALNLFCSDFYQNEDQPEFLSAYVSKTRNKLADILLERANNKYNHTESHDSKNIGALLGFPETATNAFMSGEESLLPLGDKTYTTLPSEILKQEYMAFCSFRLSKEHWEEELETVKKWAQCIKRIHPTLYTQYVQEYFSE